MDQQTEAVQRMQDYIESHLDQEITLMTLSKVSLFSPWHSHRLFKERLGLTPAEDASFPLRHASEAGTVFCHRCGL